MFIKSQLLLPRDENEETGELDDPRTELVHRLIEYKQFKEASRNLSMYEGENRYVYYRSIFEGENQLIYESTQNIYKNATIFDLLKAFQKALNRTKPVVTQHLVTLFPVTIEEKTNLIISELNAKNRILFFDIIRDLPREHLVVTFLAILELIKKQIIFIQQSDLFEDIMITKKPELALN